MAEREWKWVGNGVYEILREGSALILVRVAEIGTGVYKWRAFNGTTYQHGEESTDAQARATALRVAGLA